MTMKFVFLVLVVQYTLVNMAYANPVFSGSDKYMDGYFVKKNGQVFISDDPDRIAPSFKVIMTKKQLDGVCFGGPTTCVKIGILCKPHIENHQFQCLVSRILPARRPATAEVKMWEKLFR